MSSAMVTLTRQETNDLLFVLDDADRLFSHPLGDDVLALWQRLHLACCYLDGEQGYHGTDEQRRLTLNGMEALQILCVLSPEWIDDLRPMELRDRMCLLVTRLATASLTHVVVA